MHNHSTAFASELHDEKTFYSRFLKDLSVCTKEVIIESPYIIADRAKVFLPLFTNMLKKQVKIYVMTRDPNEHMGGMEVQSEATIRAFEVIGVQTLLCRGNHHRKLALLDRQIVWEGSLNILSQTHSREIMRRIASEGMAKQMFDFLQYERFI